MNTSSNSDFFLPFGGFPYLVHEWTKHSPANAAAVQPYLELADQRSWARYSAYPAFGLPPLTEAQTRSHFDTIQQRRSLRFWSDQPVALSELAAVLRLVCPVQSAPVHDQYHGFTELSGGLELAKIAVLTANVSGIERGAYLYDESAHALICLRNDDPMPFVSTICAQKEFLRAPVTILVGGSMVEALARYGDRGYRYLLNEIGIVLARLYFVVSSLRLVGSINGSCAFRDLERWLGFDGVNQTLAATFALGHPEAADEA